MLSVNYIFKDSLICKGHFNIIADTSLGSRVKPLATGVREGLGAGKGRDQTCEEAGGSRKMLQ